jgi:hypothetical protein
MSPAITASMTSTSRPAWSRVVRIKSTTGVPAGSSRVTDSGVVGIRTAISSVMSVRWKPASSSRANPPPGPASSSRSRGAALGHVELIVGVGELVGSAVVYRGALPGENRRSRGDAQALGSDLGRGHLADESQELTG